MNKRQPVTVYVATALVLLQLFILKLQESHNGTERES